MVVLGIGLVVWGVVGRHPAGPDFVWVPLGVLFLIGGWRTRRRGTTALLRYVALATVLLLAWAAFSHAPWRAEPPPRWLAPPGLTFGRSVALAALLAYWVGLEWWGAPGPGRATRLMPFVIGALAAAHIWPLAARESIELFFGDEGGLLDAALGLLHGEHLYRDHFAALWPGSYALTAAVFGVAGPRVGAIHLALTALMSGTVMALYVCIAREANRGWALIGALLCLTALAAQPVHWSAYWMATTSGLIATWLLTRGRMPVPTSWATAAGLATGFTLLFRQQSGVALFVCLGAAYATLAAYAIRRAGRDAAPAYLRSLAGFVAGALAPGIIAVSWYALRGDGAAFWSATFTLAEQENAVASGQMGPGDLWTVGSVTIAYVAPLGILVGIGYLLHPGTVSLPRWRWGLLLAGCVGVCAPVLLPYRYVPLVYAAPATCVLFAAGLGRIGAFGWIRGWAEKAVGCTVIGVVVSVAVFQWRAQLIDMDQRPQFSMPQSGVGPVAFVAYTPRALPDVRETLQFVSTLPAEARVFVFPQGAGYYLLTGRTNPTRYDTLRPGSNPPDRVAEVLTALDTAPVQYVVWDRFASAPWSTDVVSAEPPGGLEQNAVIDYVRAHYRPVLQLDSVTVFEREAM